MDDASARSPRLARELAEQARWRTKAPFAAERVFEDLLREEFLADAEQDERRRRALAGMLRHAARESRYWAQVFDAAGADLDRVASRDGLAHLPVLERRTVRERFADLNARRLPAGEVAVGVTHSSGTTGQPVKVTHSARSAGSFALLRQRQLRWFRFDPSAKLAHIQPARDLPPRADGAPVAPGETLRRNGWLQIDHLFDTGPGAAIDHLAPLAWQLDWLHDEAPDYLLAHCAHLEQLALGLAGRTDRPRLAGLYGISQTMTDGMRATIERVFDAPVRLVYGLNEFGIVAATCAEGGRYHVHAGHVLVELVDADGRPARAGDTGRILISGLSNAAMPMFRYDTDDFAEALDGPCPCGRTLPAFGRVVGCYRRLTHLPEGTFMHWVALQIALGSMPEALIAPVLQYQLYQRRDRVCELRLSTCAALAPAFVSRVERAWRDADAATGVALPLHLRVGAAIAAAPGGKVQSLYSEFYPRAD